MPRPETTGPESAGRDASEPEAPGPEAGPGPRPPGASEFPAPEVRYKERTRAGNDPRRERPARRIRMGAS